MALENIISNLYNQDIEHPEQIDFSMAHNNYLSALAIDSDSPEANFGAGLTGFLMVTQDPMFIEVFEQWDEWDDNNDNDNPYSYIGSGIPVNSSYFMLPYKFTLGFDLCYSPKKNTP